MKKIFLIIMILLSTSGPALADSMSEPRPESIDDAKSARRILRQSSLSAMSEKEPSETTTEIQELLKEIESLKLPEPKLVMSAKDDVIDVPKQTSIPTESDPVDAQPAVSQAPKAQPIDYLARLRDILKNNPNEIIDPLSTAEALFINGNLADASLFYQVALERMAGKEDHPDRPWALLQAANCLRKDEPKEAYKFYQQLISEYPNSQWTSTARMQQQIDGQISIIDGMQKTQNQMIIQVEALTGLISAMQEREYERLLSMKGAG